MTDVCRIDVTAEMWDAAKGCEAVLLRMYNNGTDEWGKIVACGSMDEMEMMADTVEILIVPEGMKIGKRAVRVSDLVQQ